MQIAGCFYHVTPASRFVKDIANSKAPLLSGHYPASSLLRAYPPPSRLQPISRCFRLYGLLLHQFLDGSRTVSPVAWHPLVTVLPLPSRRSVITSRSAHVMPCRLRPEPEGSASEVYFFVEATWGFTFVAVRRLAHHTGSPQYHPRRNLARSYNRTVAGRRQPCYCFCSRPEFWR